MIWNWIWPWSGLNTLLAPFRVGCLGSWLDAWPPAWPILHWVAMASPGFFSSPRWETLPLWLGRLWVEICPLRRTDQALSQTHRAPPLPVPEVWPGLLQVGPPRLTHEEALLNPQTVDMTHTARREFSIFFFFNLSHCLPPPRGWGGTQLESTTIMVKFPTSQLVNG